jgi:hypothetical protein
MRKIRVKHAPAILSPANSPRLSVVRTSEMNQHHAAATPTRNIDETAVRFPLLATATKAKSNAGKVSTIATIRSKNWPGNKGALKRALSRNLNIPVNLVDCNDVSIMYQSA